MGLVKVLGIGVSAAAVIFHTPLRQFISNVFGDKIVPATGSIVYCRLTPVAEHSGVYVGDGKIVHRDGAGYLEVVSPQKFIARLNGKNNAVSIYVSCCGKDAAGSKEVAERALAAVRAPRHGGYSLLFKNCHQFCKYCLTGGEQKTRDFSFMSLEHTLKKVYKFNKWREWETKTYTDWVCNAIKQ